MFGLGCLAGAALHHRPATRRRFLRSANLRRGAPRRSFHRRQRQHPRGGHQPHSRHGHHPGVFHHARSVLPRRRRDPCGNGRFPPTRHGRTRPPTGHDQSLRGRGTPTTPCVSPNWASRSAPTDCGAPATLSPVWKWPNGSPALSTTSPPRLRKRTQTHYLFPLEPARTWARASSTNPLRHGHRRTVSYLANPKKS